VCDLFLRVGVTSHYPTTSLFRIKLNKNTVHSNKDLPPLIITNFIVLLFYCSIVLIPPSILNELSKNNNNKKKKWHHCGDDSFCKDQCMVPLKKEKSNKRVTQTKALSVSLDVGSKWSPRFQKCRCVLVSKKKHFARVKGKEGESSVG